MILIYSDITSPRLQYTCNFIFSEQLGIPCNITIDSEAFRNHPGPKLNYSSNRHDDAFFINPHSLLFEQHIKDQPITCFEWNGYKAFFGSPGSDFPFDIFAAVFYLLSRYEEYLAHTPDLYGRYAHENSIAYKEGFLDIPLVNIWINEFAKKLKLKYPLLDFRQTAFRFIPTYDIDIAYSYKHKGLIRNLGGFVKSPSLERLEVLSGSKKDPYDSYAFLDGLHEHYALSPVYFFLVATSVSRYDKNISPYVTAMGKLIRQHAKKYKTGLHPSWRSNDQTTLLSREKSILEETGAVPVNISRQHYIKFSLPSTFEQLINAGIEEDYSMGYGSINGFRASVASPFCWYNLAEEKSTSLKLFPFCFMDANSFYEQGYNAARAYEEIMQYLHVCKKVNGTFISIFHNNFLGEDKQFPGWKEMYAKFISQVQQ